MKMRVSKSIQIHIKNHLPAGQDEPNNSQECTGWIEHYIEVYGGNDGHRSNRSGIRTAQSADVPAFENGKNITDQPDSLGGLYPPGSESGAHALSGGNEINGSISRMGTSSAASHSATAGRKADKKQERQIWSNLRVA